MKVFYDSNIFLKHLAGVSEAKNLIDKVEEGIWEGYVNNIILSEVFYGYLRLYYLVSKYKLRELIIKRVKEVKQLLKEDVVPLFESFKILEVSIDSNKLLEYISKYKLLPNDAIIVATCKENNIYHIATFDEDFQRVPWLKILS